MTVAQGYDNLAPTTGLSGPVDTTKPYDPSTLSSKTVLITGGSAGLGAAFTREWASHGANIVVGDVDAPAGEALVASLRADHPKGSHHFVYCDVTSWESQVALFKEAARLSSSRPHGGGSGGGIDIVVANAGVLGSPSANQEFDTPVASAADPDAPRRPPTQVIDVNVTGLSYTVNLGMFWLLRNGTKETDVGGGGGGGGGSEARSVNNGNSSSGNSNKDRCILLIGSVAGVTHFAGHAPYTMSKHAVTGLFRAMRATAYMSHGVRLNMLCPYFVSGSNMLPGPAEAVLLGGGAGGAAFGDVVDAATRLVADEGIVGRGLLVGPAVADDDDDDDDGEEGAEVGGGSVKTKTKIAAWDVYAEDYRDCDAFVWRWVRILNTIESVRGWFGWARDAVWIVVGRHILERRR